MIMNVKQSVKLELAVESEVLGENLPQCHLVHHRSHITDLGSYPGRRGGKSLTNRLGYGAAFLRHKQISSVKNLQDD